MLTERLKQDEDYNQIKLGPDSNKSHQLNDSPELPQTFYVKYLGSQDARGLWGIKHTRKPVDKMIEVAKSLPSGMSVPLVRMVVSEDQVAFASLNHKDDATRIRKVYPIRDVSYGVQDIVYTRIFSMIVVKDTDNNRRTTPFECHGFVCESKHQARQLTYSLADAFKMYTTKTKENVETTPCQQRPDIKINPQHLRVDIICKT